MPLSGRLPISFTHPQAERRTWPDGCLGLGGPWFLYSSSRFRLASDLGGKERLCIALVNPVESGSMKPLAKLVMLELLDLNLRFVGRNMFVFS